MAAPLHFRSPEAALKLAAAGWPPQAGAAQVSSLRALFAVVEEARREEERENAPVQETGWRP